MASPLAPPDGPDDGGRCDHCPLDRLDAAQSSEAGLLIRRALDLRVALKLNVQIGLGDIRADEFFAMQLIEEQLDKLEWAKRVAS